MLVELSTDEAKRLQEIAWETVRERFEKKADDGTTYTGFPHYGTGYATADKPLGPWTKAEENPIATTNLDIGVSGPGHQQFGWRHETSTRRQSIRERQVWLIILLDRQREFLPTIVGRN